MVKNKALVTIIIPVYNVEDYLAECLESVIHQSYRNLEILCINDSSRDNSLIILEKYQKKDKRIVIINNEFNRGASASRNIGLARAKGEFFTFVDSDDIIHPNYCEALLGGIASNDICLAYFLCFRHTKQISFRKARIVNPTPLKIDPIESILLEIVPTSTTTKLYRRSVIDNRFYEKSNYGEDFLFIFECLIKTNKVVILNKYIYYYRIRKNSLCNYPKSKINSLTKNFTKLNKINNYKPKRYNLNSYLIVLNHSLYIFLKSYFIYRKNINYKKIFRNYINILEDFFFKKKFPALKTSYNKLSQTGKSVFMQIMLNKEHISGYLLQGLIFPNFLLKSRAFTRFCFFYGRKPKLFYLFNPLVIIFILGLKTILKINRTVRGKKPRRKKF